MTSRKKKRKPKSWDAEIAKAERELARNRAAIDETRSGDSVWTDV